MLDAHDDETKNRKRYEDTFDVLDIYYNPKISRAELNNTSHAAFNLFGKHNDEMPAMAKCISDLSDLYTDNGDFIITNSFNKRKRSLMLPILKQYIYKNKSRIMSASF